jgi:hypothetical protein
VHWVQRLRHNISLGLGLTLPSIKRSISQGSHSNRAQWLVEWKHGDFVLRVPISLDSSTSGSAAWWTSVVWVSVTPLLHAVVMALWEMINDSKLLDDVVDAAAMQQKRQEYAKAARTSAQQQQVLMQRQADARRRDSGLVIHAATYYIPQSSDPLDEWDVTTALQFWVTSNGALELPGGSTKGSLLGFVDLASLSNKTKRQSNSSSSQTADVESFFSWSWWTAFGRLRPAMAASRTHSQRPPRLRVVYEYRGQRHETTVGDTERLVLPVS